MANEAAIREMMASIVRDPKSWNMGAWALKTECGTTYCAAGHAVVNAGIDIKWCEGDRWTSATVEGEMINEKAQELLGLSFEDSEAIFMATSWCIVHETMDDEDHSDEEYENCKTRHPTIREFANHVTSVTGIVFKDEDLES